MPADDFAAAGASPDPTKTYLIKGETLQRLLVKVSCNLSQFDVKETPTERIYTYKAPPNGGSSASGTGLTCDVLIRSCDDSPDDRILQRLSYEDGILVSVNATETARPLATAQYTTTLQDCHWIDDDDIPDGT